MGASPMVRMIVCFCSSILCIAAASAAVPEPVVLLGRAQLSAFTDALEAIAAQGHVAIVAEGVPLHRTLTYGDLPSLTDKARPLSEVLGTLAAAYDYELRRSGPVCVLVKRYSDPADLPSVTMGEWAECLQQIVRLTDPFNPHVDLGYHPGISPRNPIVGDLAASLTQAQLSALDGGGLRLSGLTSAQIVLVRRFALYLYVQKWADKVSKALSYLKIGERSVVFHYADVEDERHVFGCDLGFGGHGHPPWFAQLSGASSGYGLVSGAILFEMPPGVEDPSDPGDAVGRATVPPGSTLVRVVAGLNARGSGTVRVLADPVLETKAITVVGATNASVRELTFAVADAYGLSVRAIGAGAQTVLRLGLPVPTPVPARADGLPAALEGVIPPPLLHAIHAREGRESIQAALRFDNLTFRRGPPPGESDTGLTGQDPWVDETLPELRRAMQDWELSIDPIRVKEQFTSAVTASALLPGKLRMEAMKRVRARLEPRVEASPAGRVPFAALDGQDRDAFAFVIGSECLRSIGQWISRPPREYIADFNHLTLLGGLVPSPENKPPMFSLFFGISRPGGRVDQGEGIGGVLYVK